MRLKAIKNEAAKLVREMGSDALEVAAMETLRAKRQRNVRLERFRAQVAMQVFRELSRSSSSKAV